MPTGIVPDIAPPTAAAGKQKAEHAFLDAVKTDASGNNSAQTPATNAASHAQTGTANAAQTLAAASDNGAQAAMMIQPQVPSTPATPSANSPLTVTAATSHNNAVPVSGLAVEIAASAKSGKSRFEIRLDPPELGRIDVRIHVDTNGQVTSHLTVERPETLQMLRQDANQLQRALDNAGLSTGNSGLQFSLRDQSSSGQNGGNQPNPNAHRLIVSEEDSVPATVAGRSYGRMLGASGGVDIRV
jgi:flagellar hook-length control protein FliK